MTGRILVLEQPQANLHDVTQILAEGGYEVEGATSLFEATARYEVIRFRSEPSTGSLPSPSPRAANVIGNDERVWTFGINWSANHYVKFQFNGVHERLLDPSRTPIDSQNRYWSLIGRAQLFF